LASAIFVASDHGGECLPGIFVWIHAHQFRLAFDRSAGAFIGGSLKTRHPIQCCGPVNETSPAKSAFFGTPKTASKWQDLVLDH
jgi:hypothetical protein